MREKCGMLGHARRDQHRGERCGPCSAGADRGGSEQPAKARLAGADHPGDGGRAAAPRRSCAAPGCPSPASGAGRSGSCAKASTGCCATRPASPACRPCRQAVVERVVALTLGEPPGEATHWTGRAMAAASGVSLRSVQRIWAAHGLQPHRVRPSSCPPIRRSPPSSRTSSACTSIRRRTPGALGRREVPDPGARPDPAGAADQEGPGRHHDPSMHVPRWARAFLNDLASSSAAAIYPASSCSAKAAGPDVIRGPAPNHDYGF